MTTIFNDLLASRPSYNNQEGRIYDDDSSNDNKEIKPIPNLDELINKILAKERKGYQTI